MTTLETKQFFMFGIRNAEGETFRMIKEARIATSVASSAVEFYHGVGFKDVIATHCNDVVLIKDSNGRLLSFVVDVCHTKAEGTKEYRTAYWALKEVERQAEAVTEKAAAAAKKASVKVDAETNEGREVATEKKENATIKGSIEVGAPQKKPWYYAVRKGHTVGIFTDWAEASESVTGYSDARFKKFRALKDAQGFMEGGDNE
jgi:caulimovirus viroplasmin